MRYSTPVAIRPTFNREPRFCVRCGDDLELEMITPLTRIGKICKALKEFGPMTKIQISDITGIDRKNVGEVISKARQSNVWNVRIRKIGKVREGKSAWSCVFELSNEPDVWPLGALGSKRTEEAREAAADRRRIRLLAAQSQPFRDPFLFLTAGRAP